jgi:hypothetical protein
MCVRARKFAESLSLGLARDLKLRNLTPCNSYFLPVVCGRMKGAASEAT